MATLQQVMTNHPGGLYRFGEFDYYEGESLSLSVQLVEYEGGPNIDCTGWDVDSAGIYKDAARPVAGDLGVGVLASLSASGVLNIVSNAADGAAGSSGGSPTGRDGWLYVRVKKDAFSTYLIAPSLVHLRQGPVPA